MKKPTNPFTNEEIILIGTAVLLMLALAAMIFLSMTNSRL